MNTVREAAYDYVNKLRFHKQSDLELAEAFISGAEFQSKIPLAFDEIKILGLNSSQILKLIEFWRNHHLEMPK